jgi:ubiquinone/menaquinone biosynthesis C-methylase UbiE
MSNATASGRRPDYGIDAPGVIRNLLLVGVVALVVGILLWELDIPHPYGIPVSETLVFTAIPCFFNAACMVWYSRVSKLRARERLLDLIAWRGDEHVLDVGCGRGLILVGAARRLTSGEATGIDIWQGQDLSDNRPEAALENARREGVADRVEVKDGDARKIPFPDGSFDVVVSSMAIHNIPTLPERLQAIREIVRVLKPGGRVVVSDIQSTGDYAAVLRESGCSDVQRTASSLLTWLFIVTTWGAVRPYRVTGTKSAESAKMDLS